MVVAVDPLSVLALVGEERGLLPRAHRGYIHIVGRMESVGLGAEVHFVVEQLELPSAREPGAEGERARSLVIQVRIDGPLREQDVRPLRRHQLGQRLSGLAVHARRAVHLSREERRCAKNLAGRQAFRRADGGRLFMRFAANARLSAGQVNDGYVVPRFDVAGERSSASGFGIVGVTSDADDLQRLRRSRLFECKSGKGSGKLPPGGHQHEMFSLVDLFASGIILFLSRGTPPESIAASGGSSRRSPR